MAANTGPKGVISDHAAAAAEARAAAAERADARARDVLARSAVTTTVADDEAQAAVQLAAAAAAAGRPDVYREDVRAAADAAAEAEDDEFAELDDELAEFDLRLSDGAGRQDLDTLRAWRQARLRELQGAAERPARPAFGAVATVRGEQFLKELEADGDADRVVVVFLFDESDDSYAALDAAAALARKYVHARFVAMPVGETEMDRDCMPTVLGYSQCGTLVGTVVRALDELPPGTRLVAAGLETVLGRAGILRPGDVGGRVDSSDED
ncbi:uncharacterized protein V1510DRAFT_400829 [Dipodascopsis tothii]|uniref:uncharacterized protein n=1 Tax=Dipodascopsis tothii TaxID=44089 RepID=UPI0034CEEB55